MRINIRNIRLENDVTAEHNARDEKESEPKQWAGVHVLVL